MAELFESEASRAMMEIFNRRGQKIIELEKEIERLKAGNFTEEEFQNLCHVRCATKYTLFGPKMEVAE